jgi:hypothetical protein
MMKGSSAGASGTSGASTPQSYGGKGQFNLFDVASRVLPAVAFGGRNFDPGAAQWLSGSLARYGTGSTKGSQPAAAPQPLTAPMPQYVNYQQAPVYSGQPAAPSDALTRFMNSSYASGGNVRSDANSSLEDDIKAALRLARLIGELTKKE